MYMLEVQTRAVGVAVFYFICSLSMNFLNKAIVSSYDFNYPFSIMVCQMVVTLLTLDTLRLTGLVQLQSYSLKDGVEFIGASLSFALHSTLSLMALHGMNIPMYGALKRCTPLVNLIFSVTILKKPFPSSLLMISIGMITVGALVAGLGDLQFDAHAYLLAAFSVFAQACYLTLVQQSSEVHHKSTVEMIYINAYNTLPLFLTMSLVLGEPAQVADSLTKEDSSFYFIFAVLIVSGSLLTYSQFLCAAVCSALTTSMVGVNKAIIQTIIGFFTFGGVKFHPLNVSGLVLNILGGVVYTYVKHKQRPRPADRHQDDENAQEQRKPSWSSSSLNHEDENRNRMAGSRIRII